MYRLTDSEKTALIRQPESGMGYQVVDAVTWDAQPRRGVVYNGELLTLDRDRVGDRAILLTKSFPEALRLASSSTGQFRSLSVVRDPRVTTLSKRDVKNSSGASDGEVGKTKDGDKFFRFSAFPNDNRITADNALRPGSYATTEEDGGSVKTGAEAVERYALPNDDPASHRFVIRPVSQTALQSGIVQPANGHQGGGVEVIFTAGTTAGTVTLPPATLPDK